MKEILVDTNVLISFLTDRNPKQQKQADILFKAAEDRRHRLVLHTIAISETVYVLTTLYKYSPREVAIALGKLLALPGVTSAGEVTWGEVLTLWPKSIRNFGDAILAAIATQGYYDAIATFDRPLRKKLVKLGASPYWTD